MHKRLPHLAMFSTIISAIALLTAPISAMASHPEQADGIRVFPLDFFEAVQPRTALDLVDRLPGFTINGGDGDVRGYAGSVGNVLIDGQRPVSKNGGVQSALQRIPVDAVERVELIRGTTPGIDMQGWPVVANVIRRAEGSSSARALFAARLYEDSRLRPEARFEAMQSSPDSLLEGTLHLYDVKNDSGPGYRRRATVDGQSLYEAKRRIDAETQGFSATLGYQEARFGGDMRAGAVISGSRSGSTEILEESLPLARNVTFDKASSSLNAELGIQFGIEAGEASRVEFLAIQQLTRFDSEDSQRSDDGSGWFSEEGDTGETILRATVRSDLPRGRTVEWGGETAFNFLSSRAQALADGEPVALPAAAADVAELRGEVFGRFAFMPAADLSAEVGAAMEYSRISQEGAAGNSKSLPYFKPRVALTYTPTTEDQLRVGLQRVVGQLDFGDFASSAEFSSGTVNIGNTDLVPSTSWDFAASWERQLPGDATLVVSLLHSEIADVIDIAPIAVATEDAGVETVYEGVANIGDGALSEIGFNLNLPLDNFGVLGGLLNTTVVYVRTSVDDPVTGARRRISGIEYPWDASIAFTQDLPERSLRWGVTVPFGDMESEYRLREVRVEEKNLRLDLFAEYFPDPAWAIGIALQNMTRRERTLARDYYDAPRDVGVIEARAYEFLALEPHIRLYAQRDFL